MTTLIIIAIIVLLPVLYNLLFPVKPPVLENYFKPGQTYYSAAEGIKQTVLRQVGNKVFCELQFDPLAAGPPEHVHLHMHEYIHVAQGTLSAKLNGEVKQFHAGQRLEIPAGMYHKMFNATESVVILRPETEEEYVSAEFAYSLEKLYPIMPVGGGVSLKLIAKISVLDNLFDSIPAGPPPIVFKVVKKIVKPYARVFGVTIA